MANDVSLTWQVSTIRARIVNYTEGGADTGSSFTHRTPAAGTELIHSVDMETCLAKEPDESDALRRFVEAHVLTLVPITHGNEGILWCTANELLETIHHASIRDLFPLIVAESDVAMFPDTVEGIELSVEKVLGKYVILEVLNVCSFRIVIRSKRSLQILNSTTMNSSLSFQSLETLPISLGVKTSTASILRVPPLPLLLARRTILLLHSTRTIYNIK